MLIRHRRGIVLIAPVSRGPHGMAEDEHRKRFQIATQAASCFFALHSASLTPFPGRLRVPTKVIARPRTAKARRTSFATPSGSARGCGLDVTPKRKQSKHPRTHRLALAHRLDLDIPTTPPTSGKPRPSSARD